MLAAGLQKKRPGSWDDSSLWAGAFLYHYHFAFQIGKIYCCHCTITELSVQKIPIRIQEQPHTFRWLEKVNSSAKVNSTALLKVAYNLVIFKKKSGIYAIIQVIYGEIFCFSVWQTSCWRSVCTTKFHQPHLKNVKSLLPVWQQISSWVSGYSGSA